MKLDFKEWLIDEKRLKGLWRAFSDKHKEMPKYVMNQLYDTRIGHTLNKIVKSSSNTNEKISSNPNFKPSSVPTNSVSKIFHASGFKNSEWDGPRILTWNFKEGVTPANFTPETQKYFLIRCFGFKAEQKIRNDQQRMIIQKNIMHNSKTDNEPVIVLLTLQGYELLEGWHRTMNYLLTGCPADQLENLKNGISENIDFSRWKPVRIKAYIGKGPETQKAINTGTGRWSEED